MFRAALLACAALVAAPAAAQQLVGEYYAYIVQRDLFNSSGVRLRDFGSILQQDRANFYRFGIRQQWDQPDPYFSNRELRAAIPALYARGNGAPGWIVNDVLNGREGYVYVRIYGSGGRLMYLDVFPGAG